MIGQINVGLLAYNYLPITLISFTGYFEGTLPSNGA